MNGFEGRKLSLIEHETGIASTITEFFEGEKELFYMNNLYIYMNRVTQLENYRDNQIARAESKYKTNYATSGKLFIALIIFWLITMWGPFSFASLTRLIVLLISIAVFVWFCKKYFVERIANNKNMEKTINEEFTPIYEEALSEMRQHPLFNDLPTNYININAVQQLIQYLENGQAQNLGQAINLLDQQEFRNQQLAMQQEQQQLLNDIAMDTQSNKNMNTIQNIMKK